MIAISAGGRSLRVFPAADAAAPLIVLSTFRDGGMDVWKETKALTDADFSLAAVSCNDWSGDMTPMAAWGIQRERGWIPGSARKGDHPCGNRDVRA